MKPTIFRPCTALASIALAGTAVPQSAGLEPQPILQEIERLQIAFWPNRPSGVNYRACDANWHHQVADMNGDGRLDLVIGHHSEWRQMRLLLGDGHGTFSDVTLTQLPSARRYSYGFRIGDIDGDGDLDIVGCTDDGVPPQLVNGFAYINDGTGRFADETVLRIPGGLAFARSFYSVHNSGIALADFDRDGDLDIVMAGPRAISNLSCYMLENDGRGRFSLDATAFAPDGGYFRCHGGEIFEFDADGDGDIDLVSNSWTGPVGYWLNDGTGGMVLASLTHVHPTPNFISLDVQPGDVDGDGDVDLAVTVAYVPQPVRLYLNDGTGHLSDVTATHMPNDTQGGPAIRFADLDGDGDLDLLNTVQSYVYQGQILRVGKEEVLLNDGAGRFRNDRSGSVLLPVPNGTQPDILVADLDDDGDIDVMIPDLGAGWTPNCRTRYYSNTTRQIYADLPATRGRPWRLTTYAPPGAVAVVAYGMTELRSATPFGNLYLDPATLLIWPTVLSFGPDRNQSVLIPIPDLPILAGVPIYAQALVVEPSGRARFSNLWVERAIR